MPQGVEARNQSGQLPLRSFMEYRGSQIHDHPGDSTARRVAGRTAVGKPPITRKGEASTEMQAELHVKKLIDWYEERRVARDKPTNSD